MIKNKISNIISWVFAIGFTTALFLIPGIVILRGLDRSVLEIITTSAIIWIVFLVIVSAIVEFFKWLDYRKY
jgi:hypothetical protein